MGSLSFLFRTSIYNNNNNHNADNFIFLYFISSSVHNSRTTRQWLVEHPEIVALDWPVKGADMNPIENLWGHLVVALNKSRNEQGLPFHARDANGADELYALVNSEWQKLMRNETYIESLIESMPRRLQEVINEEGGWTKY
jgi:hypothetical protein